jgi:RHS repeat-associated protein
LNGSTVTTTPLTSWLNNQPVPPNTKPKAYINWILLDEQFRPVSGGSGFDAVGIKDSITSHQKSVNILKNGYLYVYCSNESNIDVFFDNLQVIHSRGPLLEETHYYPFGLTMAGISSKAAGKLENRKKYNGIEFNDDLDVDTYEAFYRNLDPQIGRWWQVDPELENDMESLSPYLSMFNNPISQSDPLGNNPDGDGDDDGWWEKAKSLSKKVVGGAAGLIVGGVDNVLGTNLRIAAAQHMKDPDIAGGWNSGLDVVDAASIATGVGESSVGTGVVEGSIIITAGTGGASIEITGPAAAGGGLMVAHGIFLTKNGAFNLVTQNGRVNMAAKKGPKDLVQEAKDAQLKEEQARLRTEKRENASRQGQNKTGNSNQEVRGDHNNTNNGGGKAKKSEHQNANARRAREQAAADAKNAASKKKKK